MKKKYLLGANADKEIVFAEFEATKRNGYPEFSASFDAVRPFKGDDVDLYDYFSNFVDDIGKAEAYDMCERYDCSPRSLPKILAAECGDPRDALDCSLYPEEYDIDGEYWYFESGCCGQYDTRKEGMDEYVNKEAYDMLHELWDTYHLKEIDEIGIEKMNKVTAMLERVDEEEWIINYIKRNS